MTNNKNVLLVAHDRGGVNLLVPLLMHWHRAPCAITAQFLSTPMIQHEVASMAHAAFGVTPQPSDTPTVTAVPMQGFGDSFVGRGTWTFTDDQLRQVLDSRPWDLVLTGTSAISEMEKTTWALCRERAIPCAAMCDMWTEYHRRLIDQSGSIGITDLLVLDQRMAAEVNTAFGDAVQPIIVGSPHFAHLIETRHATHRSPSSEPGAIRFISEPIAALFPNAGVHEFSVAKMFISAAGQANCAGPIVLRPHPQDDSEGWRRFAFDYRDRGVRLDDEPSWACPMTTRIAVGISSMMLIEFAIAGIPAASFRPAGADEEYFCLHEDEFGIAILRNLEQLVDWLHAPQQPHIDPQFLAHHQQAMTVITDLVHNDTLRRTTPAHQSA